MKPLSVPWIVLYGLTFALLCFACAGCFSTPAELRELADRLEDTQDFAAKTAATVSELPGWPGILGSVASTVLTGGMALNKYRNLTRETDPRVSNRSASHA